jgi:polyisoprenoid-binding protein YceI
VKEPGAPADVNASATAALSATATPSAPAPSAASQTLALDTTRSKLQFVGAKVTGDHRGTFQQYAGNLTLNADGSVSTLAIEVQTASLAIEPEKLLGHLKSADFFEVERFPVARFALNQFTPQAGEAGATHRVGGELELHGVRKQIEFPATVAFAEGEISASALFTINRKDFGIVYPGKPDDLIKDDVLLDLQLRFPRT